MPAAKSSRGGTKAKPGTKGKRAGSASAKAGGRGNATAAAESESGDGARDAAEAARGFTEDLVNRMIRPLDLVLLTRDRIQATLDEAAERGRVTRSDANELVAELVRRGRQQTDDIVGDLEELIDRGRGQVESATRRARRTPPVDRLVRSADRARRTVGAGPAFPIMGYDDLTVGQVAERLPGLTPPQLRKVRDYERRHANRKSVLASVEKLLA